MSQRLSRGIRAALLRHGQVGVPETAAAKEFRADLAALLSRQEKALRLAASPSPGQRSRAAAAEERFLALWAKFLQRWGQQP